MKMHIQRLVGLVSVAVGACSGGSDDGGAPAPSLFALSKDEISVGESLDFIGEGYLDGHGGYTEISLEGDYLADGGTYPVAFRFRPAADSDTRLVWSHFGPYDIPFSPTGDELGVFEGTATAVNLAADGSEVASLPLAVSLRVGPSILVRALEPVAAECEQPVSRLLGGFRYRLVTEAVGIEPVDFTLEIQGEPSGERRVFRQSADGAIASFGEDGDLTLEPAPDGQVFYVMRAQITARDAAGDTIDSEYAIDVHRPFEYIEAGEPEVGQIESALPVSGCHSGGADGRQVAYAEQSADVRERQLSTSWNQRWMENHGDRFSPPEANEVSLRFRVTETDGWTADWKDGDVIVGQVSATEAAEWALRQTTHVVIGSDGLWRIRSSDVIPSGTSGEVGADMFGVWYRQTSRMVRPGAIVAYDLCGHAQVTGEASFIDYSWDTSLAEGDQCPPFPEPDLPPAECYIAPCL